MNAKTYWTCQGRVRGCCGIHHRTLEASARCCVADNAGCKAQGGYSDRWPTHVVDGKVVTLTDTDCEEITAAMDAAR